MTEKDLKTAKSELLQEVRGLDGFVAVGIGREQSLVVYVTNDQLSRSLKSRYGDSFLGHRLILLQTEGFRAL